jgi:hypothetical protein
VRLDRLLAEEQARRVTFQEGRIASIFEYYGERAHEDLLQRIGTGC